MEAVRDALNRPLRDLRISLTDRCNFRCQYCMPKEIFGPGYAFLPFSEVLTAEEILRTVRILQSLGVSKVRLTGGEPLLRRDILSIVEGLSQMNLEEIALTTNGTLLPRLAPALKEKGLTRVTVSLDALDDATFQTINGVGYPVAQVLEAIEAAAKAGLHPVKINAVIQKGVNEHAVLDLAGYFRHTPHVLRFIEYMDVGTTNGWRMEAVVTAKEIFEMIHQKWPLQPLPPRRPGEVARRFRYQDGAGEIGVIASVTQPFCRGCNRLRLSADGQLFLCLFASQGFPLKKLLREGASDEAIRESLRALWQGRDDRYSELRSVMPPKPRPEMHYLGG
ncbi:MAG: GTP 3',8-cyclase MoaA [Bacillota bacterium]|nr:GTP 3',8-cyclase MoaA [Bacillota bacterium]